MDYNEWYNWTNIGGGRSPGLKEIDRHLSAWESKPNPVDLKGLRSAVIKWINNEVGHGWKQSLYNKEPNHAIKELIEVFKDVPPKDKYFSSQVELWLMDTDKDRIAFINRTWGICGFVAAIEAAYDDPTFKSALINIRPCLDTPDGVNQMFHKIIRQYLIDRKKQNKMNVLNSIQNISRVLTQKGNLVQFDINTLIDKLKHIAPDLQNMDNTGDKMIHLLGSRSEAERHAYDHISMTPSTLIDFLDYLGLMGTLHNLGVKENNSIQGLGLESSHTASDCFGLKHWVYVDKVGKVHSWGNTYDDYGDGAKGLNTDVLIIQKEHNEKQEKWIVRYTIKVAPKPKVHPVVVH